MTRLSSPPTDSVSETLRSLSVRSSIFCLSELRAPWALRVKGEEVAKFHLVLEGSGFLLCGAKDPVFLDEGDLVVLPHGPEHTLADNPASTAIALDELLAEIPAGDGERLRYGGTGPVTRVLCGGFSLAEGPPGVTLAAFPELVRIRREKTITTWAEPMLETLNAEAESGLPGANAIVSKIADVFLAQALRLWLVESEHSGRLTTSLIDHQPIAKALHALNSRPSEAWSLDRLAHDVGLSRTALATKFRDLIGEPPMRYLTRLRLAQAAGYLSTGRLTIHEIARLTGYSNEASLSKAFKRQFGQSPGAFRTRSRLPMQIEIA